MEFDRLLDVSEIAVADEIQTREQIDQGVIDEYAEAIENGVAMPPLDVFRDGSRYVLVDGRHRLEAHKKSGIAGVQCRIHEGGFREAKLWAVGSWAR